MGHGLSLLSMRCCLRKRLPLMVPPRYFESVFVVDEVVVSNWCYGRR